MVLDLRDDGQLVARGAHRSIEKVRPIVQANKPAVISVLRRGRDYPTKADLAEFDQLLNRLGTLWHLPEEQRRAIREARRRMAPCRVRESSRRCVSWFPRPKRCLPLWSKRLRDLHILPQTSYEFAGATIVERGTPGGLNQSRERRDDARAASGGRLVHPGRWHMNHAELAITPRARRPAEGGTSAPGRLHPRK